MWQYALSRKKIKLENPQAISSNKLRKQIATIMQILNLSKAETKQFSDFMGHTLKTQEEFYELPVDIFQTAKVSKLLLMMEKGSIPAEYKGKSLAEINFDNNLEYAEENDINDDAEIQESDQESENNKHTQRSKKSGKKRWSNSEITLLEKRFKFHIKRKQYPSGKELSEFIQKHQIKRSVAIVKSKLQHLMKLR
ncbi:hypothetical protein MML48_2g00016979 [Holotrichia oblita]|uniref:Uncharacterized protein n=1 Tax=Holotrichia oblita TaxID=644536 RepID=A0ACB9TMH5_HOLOL|nr:hypothetical protein MML48_2g00016979 [Holotrichia oblita]